MIKMVRGRQVDITPMLPVDAWLRDMGLMLVLPYEDQDPVYLLDSSGTPIREWPYIPSMGEIDDACEQG